MTTPTTGLCDAPACRRAPTAGRMCRAHHAQTGQWLADIASLWSTLTAVHGRQGDHGTTRTTIPASRLSVGSLDVMALRDLRTGTWGQQSAGPYHWACAHDTCTAMRGADDERDANAGRLLSVLGVLHGWADRIRLDRRLAAPTTTGTYRRPGAEPGPWHPDCAHPSCQARRVTITRTLNPTVPSERLLLATHLDWALTQDWAADLWADVRAVWGALKAAHGDRAGRPVATCTTIGHDGRCGGPVWAERGAAWCGLCGATWTGAELLTFGRTRPTVAA